jgi:hypothetical protein
MIAWSIIAVSLCVSIACNNLNEVVVKKKKRKNDQVQKAGKV